MWKDGWPVAGENAKEGTYEIESPRTGTALELAVEGSPVGGGRRGGGGGRGAGFGGPGGGRGPGGAPGASAARWSPAERQPERRLRRLRPADALRALPARLLKAARPPDAAVGAEECSAARAPRFRIRASRRYPLTGPSGKIDTSHGRSTCARPSRSGRFAPAPNAGGYPGSPYFKITIAGTNRALAATEDAELVVLPEFTGAPEQLWRIDQLADGSYRIMPKAVPNSKEPHGDFGHRRQLRDAGEVRPGERQTALAA